MATVSGLISRRPLIAVSGRSVIRGAPLGRESRRVRGGRGIAVGQLGVAAKV